MFISVGRSKSSTMSIRSVIALLSFILLVVVDIDYVTCMSIDRLGVDRNEIQAEKQENYNDNSDVLVDDMELEAVPALGNTDMYVLVPAGGALERESVDKNTIENGAEEEPVNASENESDMLMMETNDVPAVQVVAVPVAMSVEEKSEEMKEPPVELVKLEESSENGDAPAEAAPSESASTSANDESTGVLADKLEESASLEALTSANEAGNANAEDNAAVEAESDSKPDEKPEFEAVPASQQESSDESETVADIIADAVEKVEKEMESEIVADAVSDDTAETDENIESGNEKKEETPAQNADSTVETTSNIEASNENKEETPAAEANDQNENNLEKDATNEEVTVVEEHKKEETLIAEENVEKEDKKNTSEEKEENKIVEELAAEDIKETDPEKEPAESLTAAAGLDDMLAEETVVSLVETEPETVNEQLPQETVDIAPAAEIMENLNNDVASVTEAPLSNENEKVEETDNKIFTEEVKWETPADMEQEQTQEQLEEETNKKDNDVKVAQVQPTEVQQTEVQQDTAVVDEHEKETELNSDKNENTIEDQEAHKEENQSEADTLESVENKDETSHVLESEETEAQNHSGQKESDEVKETVKQEVEEIPTVDHKDEVITHMEEIQKDDFVAAPIAEAQSEPEIIEQMPVSVETETQEEETHENSQEELKPVDTIVAEQDQVEVTAEKHDDNTVISEAQQIVSSENEVKPAEQSESVHETVAMDELIDTEEIKEPILIEIEPEEMQKLPEIESEEIQKLPEIVAEEIQKLPEIESEEPQNNEEPQKNEEILEEPQKIESNVEEIPSMLTTIIQAPVQEIQQPQLQQYQQSEDDIEEEEMPANADVSIPNKIQHDVEVTNVIAPAEQIIQVQLAATQPPALIVADSVLNYVNASFMQQNNKQQPPLEEDNETYNAELRRYDGAQVWRVVVQNDRDKKLADELQTKFDGQLWKEVKQEVDYLLKPQVLAEAEQHLRAANLSRIVLIDDLQNVIEVENPPAAEIAQLQNRKGHRLTWQAYHRLADIHGFFDYMAKTYPDICSVETIGYTVQKRPLKILKISNGNAGNPGFWIDGGMHAREWISPASVTYIANQLVEGWDDLPAHMKNVDWYIHAVANPDGYEYSHTTDRLWRKNLRAHGRQCPGVDLNRNFGYKWGGKGTSANPCSQTYRGSKAFSEPETFYISKFISNYPRNTFSAFVSFHSYGQYILYPWGYDYQLTSDRADLDRVARQAGSIITKSSGLKYTVGSSATTLYPAAGGSDDWAKGFAGIKYSYTIEMGDTGRYGFVLPASYIESNGKDAYIFVETIARAIKKGKDSRKRRH